jgi:hypothetical protein
MDLRSRMVVILEKLDRRYCLTFSSSQLLRLRGVSPHALSSIEEFHQCSGVNEFSTYVLHKIRFAVKAQLYRQVRR